MNADLRLGVTGWRDSHLKVHLKEQVMAGSYTLTEKDKAAIPAFVEKKGARAAAEKFKVTRATIYYHLRKLNPPKDKSGKAAKVAK